MSTVSVSASTVFFQEKRAGSTPSTVLHLIRVQPIPFTVAREILVRDHYLHSFPGGTVLAFGVFIQTRLLGAVTFGSGPANAYRLVNQARPDHCLTLSRLWLSEELPSNSESRVIGVILRALKKGTGYKFLVSYADPAHGHQGTIYQATGWLYTGLSQATPLFDLGDGRIRHSRSLSHAYGSHSIRHFNEHGVNVRVIPQSSKYRYLYFLDPEWQLKLKTIILPYPKKEVSSENK
jgi:hypothetical protein